MMTQFNYLAAWLKAHAKSDRGASLVEYALLVALIAVVAIAAIKVLSGGINKTLTDAGSELSEAN